MINTLSIALNGLRIGADPLEISVQGFLVEPTPTPAPFEPVGGFYLVPVWPRHEPVKPQKRKNRDVSVEVQGCTLSVTCAEPEIRFSMSFDVVGCSEENELETYLMAEAAFKMLFEDDPDPKDLRIRSLERDLRELREQISRGKRLRK